METCEFSSEAAFDLSSTHAKFVYPSGSTSCGEPSGIYRYDPTHFEFQNIAAAAKEDGTTLYEFTNANDFKEDTKAQIDHVSHFYIKDTLYFLIAAESKELHETLIYLLQPSPSKENKLIKLRFHTSIKGTVTNIFVSRPLKNAGKNDYHVVTIGTLDSAIYVFRVDDFRGMTKPKFTKTSIQCALLRTDARNAISQQILVLDSQSKSPSDVYLVCGGSNGIMDFFLLKADAVIENEPELQFVRHRLIKLPSNLPIICIQSFPIPGNDKQVLLVVHQELKKNNRVSRTMQPSVSVIKLDVQEVLGKDVKSIKFTSGTHLQPLEPAKEGHYQFWAWRPDTDNALLLSRLQFDPDQCTFGDRINRSFACTLDDLQALAPLDLQPDIAGYVLNKQFMCRLKSENTARTQRLKRQHST